MNFNSLSSDAQQRLRAIGFTPQLQRAALAAGGDDDLTAWRVIEQQRSHWTVFDGTAQLDVPVTGGWADRIAVGDWLLARPRTDGSLELVTQIEPSSELTRATGHGRQVLVRNVDLALLVMGLDHDFNPRRIERYLALAAGGGVAPLVVLTKRDLAADADARFDRLRARLPGAVPIVAVDGTAAATAALLAPWLDAGTTAVLLGSSGAGKSTLTNTLAGMAVQATGAVRADDSRGRHTTTVRTLRQLPTGACVIDTPGLRALSLAVDDDDLDAAFSDIALRAADCRFRDCTHDTEPGCAVRDAIDPDRLRNWRKLAREAQRQQAKDSADPNALARFQSEQKSKWKAIHKSVRAFNKANRSG